VEFIASDAALNMYNGHMLSTIIDRVFGRNLV